MRTIPSLLQLRSNFVLWHTGADFDEILLTVHADETAVAPTRQSPHRTRTVLSGQTIINELIRNMEQGRFELAYTVLLPCAFSIYLNPEDHARLAGVFDLISEDAKRALRARVSQLNTPPTVLGVRVPRKPSKE